VNDKITFLQTNDEDYSGFRQVRVNTHIETMDELNALLKPHCFCSAVGIRFPITVSSPNELEGLMRKCDKLGFISLPILPETVIGCTEYGIRRSDNVSE
jgi:hypothetical protein